MTLLTTTTSADDAGGARQPASPRAAWLTAAGLASLGAGAIHAAAIGVHAEHRPAAMAFTVVAALQIAWGGLALVRPTRAVAVLGVVLNTGVFAGWVLAKWRGIGFVDGLDVAEPIQAADGLAAGLAALSVGLAAFSWRSAATTTTTATTSSSSAAPTMAPTRALVPIAAIGVAALTVWGMATAGTHVHSHGETGLETAAGAHDHDHAASGATPAAVGANASDGHTDHDHASAAVAPVPYDPKKPIDLGGVPGVTPEQQAAAENVVAVTLLRLPKWSDYKTAEAAGFFSIGDGATGVEHYISDANMDDDTILDPDKPESLVYSTQGGTKRLVAAMYMLKRGTPMSEVPDVGGKLMQWHIHNNLCYFPNGRLGGLTDKNGNCRPGLIKPVETPMIHVWIEPHKCGPFAALEGIGGGQIAEGETKLCDHAHGSS